MSVPLYSCVNEKFLRDTSFSSSSSSSPYYSTRQSYLPCTLISSTINPSSVRSIISLSDTSTKSSYWTGGKGTIHDIILRVGEKSSNNKSLLGFVKLHNRQCTSISVFISTSNPSSSTSSYVHITTENNLPSNKSLLFPVGYLPVTIVRIRINKGFPPSLNRIQLIGVDGGSNGELTSMNSNSLLVDKPANLITEIQEKHPISTEDKKKYPLTHKYYTDEISTKIVDLPENRGKCSRDPISNVIQYGRYVTPEE